MCWVREVSMPLVPKAWCHDKIMNLTSYFQNISFYEVFFNFYLCTVHSVDYLITHTNIFIYIFFYFYLMHAPLLQAILYAPWLLPTLLYIILLCIQFGDSTTYKFVLYNLSKVIPSVNFLKVLLYLLKWISLLMGHFSVRSTAAFSLFLSCSTSSQSYILFIYIQGYS
jgi:hypothetical protein